MASFTVHWAYQPGDQVALHNKPEPFHVLGLTMIYGQPAYYVTDSLIQHNPKTLLYDTVLESEIDAVTGSDYPGAGDAQAE